MTLSESRRTGEPPLERLLPVSRSALFDRPRVQVGGVQIALTTLHDAVEELITAACAPTRQGFAVRLVNAYSVSLAASDPVYRALLNAQGVALPDGAPLARIVRFKSRRSRVPATQVRGPSLFVNVLDRGRRAGLRHFFLGATRETLDSLTDELDRRIPGVALAGTWAPPFGPLDDAFYTQAIERVEAARPDVLWLGLGTPKQDFAAAVLALRLGIPTIGIGAAFDFFAGTVPEAPQFYQRHGLEWLHRLSKEPKRLWKRYLLGNLRFLLAVVADELRPHPLRRG